MGTLPKYSLKEIERRWLIAPDAVARLSTSPFRLIEDLYVAGSRLRLRRIESPDGAVTYKLGKKYGRCGRWTEPITNLYLTADEYRVLAALPGHRVVKKRYSVAGGSVDVYSSPNPGLAIFEVEFESEDAAGEYVPPSFAAAEISECEEYDGAAVAGCSAPEARGTSAAPDRQHR